MHPQPIGQLKSHPLVRRHPANPLLSPKDIPYPSDLVFNAGVAKYQGTYVMVFRNDYGWTSGSTFAGTNLGVATSKDGINWDVRPKPWVELHDEEISRIYDPRITVLEGRAYLCFAVETQHGLRAGIGVTDDFESFEIISMTVPDNRNMVLFPEKLGGMYVRLERPFPKYSRGGIDRFDMWMSDSPDLRYWGNSQLVLAVEDVPFANDKIGPGAPPVRTSRGWLEIIHAVDIDYSRGENGWEGVPWQKRYTMGAVLLDLENPSRVTGMCKVPLLVPETSYECEKGYRNDVIFPGGVILEDSGEVKIYYGAADTVEALATIGLDDLLGLCTEARK